jgi:hypothetical protein
MDSPDSDPGRRVPDGFRWAAPDGLRELMEEFEGQLAQGMERLVAGEGFSELLVAMTENTVAVWRMSADVWDLVWRGLRLPGRADIDRLARQQARTEDKLELVLQAVEQLQDRELGAERARAPETAPASERARPWSSERAPSPPRERAASWSSSPGWRPSPD